MCINSNSYKMKRILSIILVAFIAGNLFAQLDRSTPPPAGPAPTINIGEYKKFKLKNGLQVFVVEDHKLPFVAYSLNLETDPVLQGEAAGYVSLAGSLMRSGTSARSKAQIDDTIDFIGATLSTSSQGVYARSLKKHSETLLQIMSDVVMNPSYPQDELEKSVRQWVSGIQAEKNDPNAIANNIATVLRNGTNDPYGEIVTEETLERINVNMLKNYHSTYFRPNVAYLVIVGDISMKEAKAQANKYFGKWKKAPVPTHYYQLPASFEEPKVVIANRDGANQSTIQVTHAVALTPGDNDAIKASVMNQVLGGGSFNARLFQNLREEKGYTYGAYSSLRTDKRIGSFSASASVRTSVTDSALHEVLHEMTRLQTELVSDEDLELVKNMMMGSFSRSLEDPQTIARFALNIERYKLPADYYKTYLEKVAAVTPQDVMDMANKYLRPENAIIMAVGEADKIREVMKAFCPSGTVTQYDYYVNKVAPPRNVTNLSAQDVIENYIDALGGRNALKNVKDMTMNASTSMQGMTFKIVTRQKAPNKILVETLMGGNPISMQVFDGKNGKIVSPMGEQKLEGDLLKEIAEAAVLFPELYYTTDGTTLELQGIDNLDGGEAYKLLVKRPSGKETTVYFDVESGLKVREVNSGMQGTVISSYKNYEKVSGINFPTAMTQLVGPQNLEIIVESTVVNSGIADDVFVN